MFSLIFVTGCGGSSDVGSISGSDDSSTPAASPSPGTVNPSILAMENQVKVLVNAERAKVGKPPLDWNDSLLGVARAHSMDMSNRGFFSHINPDGKGPGDRLANAGIQYDAVAENIAQNQNSSDPVTQAVNEWMNPAKARGATDMNNIIDSENQG